MSDEELLEKLEELAAALGYNVRYEPAGGRSGSGIVHGQKLAVVDSGQRLRSRVEALACIVADEDYEHVYLAPAVRELLEKYCEGE